MADFLREIFSPSVITCGFHSEKLVPRDSIVSQDEKRENKKTKTTSVDQRECTKILNWWLYFVVYRFYSWNSDRFYHEVSLSLKKIM